MEAVGIGWMGAASAFAFLANLAVNLGGSIVALVLFIRYRHPASVLALVGFGLPTVVGPVLTLSRSFVATLALVVAIWLALKGRHVREDQQV